MPTPERSRALASAPAPVRVIAVTSGKGGVGKTTVAINLAYALARLGRRTFLLDADLGLGNVDVMLALRPARTLAHVIDGECSIGQTVLQGPGGIGVIPAASGVQRMADLLPAEHAGLVHAFSHFEADADVLIVDTSAGIAPGVTAFCNAAQEVLLVVCNEPASITDAYATIKVLNQDYGRNRFRVLVNMARSPQEGQLLFQKLLDVTERFLDVALDLVGTIPEDGHVRRAIARCRAVLDLYPSCPAAVALKKLADRADRWPLPSAASGKLEFFVERMVRARALEGQVLA